jgi:hypothetical protein
MVFGGDGEQSMTSVTTGGPGLVAVGWDGSLVGGSAAVWTSTDGLVWSRVSHDESVFGGDGGQSMEDLVVGGPGLVAVGSDSRGFESVPAVWTSTDGLVWSRVAHDEAVFGLRGSMDGVAVAEIGLVAVGSEWPEHGTYGSALDFDAAVWTSVDGITWSRVPHDESALGGDGWQFMRGVFVGDPGLVAFGGDSGPGDGGVVWVSADGITWSRIPDVGNGAVLDVASGGSGLVAVGLVATDCHPLPDIRPCGDVHAAVWVATSGS